MKLHIDNKIVQVWLDSYKVETEIEDFHGIHYIDNESYEIGSNTDLTESQKTEIWLEHSQELIDEYNTYLWI